MAAVATCRHLLRGCLSRPAFVNNAHAQLQFTRYISAMPVSEAFSAHGLVPDVIPKAPTNKLEVAYGSHKVELGNVLTPTQVQDRPTMMVWPTVPNALYTLILTDPDAPSRKEPTSREWHHWLVANIPGTDVTKGDVLSDYIGSGPPVNTGLHRYAFLVYKQGGKLTDAAHGHLTNTSPDRRGGWRAHAFARKHALGDPVAGNFFQAEYDDYVPILHKKIRGQ